MKTTETVIVVFPVFEINKTYSLNHSLFYTENPFKNLKFKN